MCPVNFRNVTSPCDLSRMRRLICNSSAYYDSAAQSNVMLIERLNCKNVVRDNGWWSNSGCSATPVAEGLETVVRIAVTASLNYQRCGCRGFKCSSWTAQMDEKWRSGTASSRGVRPVPSIKLSPSWTWSSYVFWEKINICLINHHACVRSYLCEEWAFVGEFRGPP